MAEARATNEGLLAGREGADMRWFLEQFRRRDAHAGVQFVKYALAGVAATIVDVLFFYLCAATILPALTAGDPVALLLGLHPSPIPEAVRSSHYVGCKVIAFMFANMAAYVANALWVFTPGRYGKKTEIALFYAVSIFTFSMGTGLGWLMIHWTGLPTTYAYIANAAASVSLNFLLRKFVVFKH
jgi:putative flippase GtrA